VHQHRSIEESYEKVHTSGRALCGRESSTGHVLGKVARRIGDDWRARWGYSPVLMESFVDPRYYLGSCYRAAG